LPVTEDFARRVFGLPFFHDLTTEQFEHVLAALTRSLP